MSDSSDMSQHEGALIDGRYRLGPMLGEGVFGAVYRASHIAYEVELRPVAVKIAKRPMSNSEARRFFGDAIIMARVVDHLDEADLQRHFVMVYDAGRCPESGPLAGHPYMVMELVNALPLSRCLDPGPFPLKRAIAYFEQIVKAVACMHRGYVDTDGKPKPVIHRDLKPSNILVVRNRDGKVSDQIKISDFGLAVEVDSLLGWAESGGDLAHLAPESLSQNLSSPQSDVYMLGLIFYQMISGKNPFEGVGCHLRGTDEEKRDELRKLHLRARSLEKFSELKGHAELHRHPGLRQVIEKALAFDMTSREFKDANTLKAGWERVMGGDVTPAIEKDWERVQGLCSQAVQFFALRDESKGMSLLQDALELNRRVPKNLVVGECYLLMVKKLIQEKKLEEAGKLAQEGFSLRQCKSTFMAMAHYCEAKQSFRIATEYSQKAQDCPDPE